MDENNVNASWAREGAQYLSSAAGNFETLIKQLEAVRDNASTNYLSIDGQGIQAGIQEILDYFRNEKIAEGLQSIAQVVNDAVNTYESRK